MKSKVILLVIIGLLAFTLWGCAKNTSSTHTDGPPFPPNNIFYTIYYGRLNELPTPKIDWSKYKLIIIKSLKEEAYHNLANPKAYKVLQEIRGKGVEVFICFNIGRLEEDSYLEAGDKEKWLTEAKKDISLYLLYADGIFLDKAGGVKSTSVVSGVKELTNFVHTQGGQIIISDLADTFQAQIENPQLKQFLPADYYLLENCWTSYTESPQNPQYHYQNVAEQIRIIDYGKENGAKVLGLSWGNPDNTEKFKYVYLLSKAVGLSGLCYANPVGQHENEIYQPSLTYRLGKPLGACTTKKELYNRQYEGGTIYVDTDAHQGWIKR